MSTNGNATTISPLSPDTARLASIVLPAVLVPLSVIVVAIIIVRCATSYSSSSSPDADIKIYVIPPTPDLEMGLEPSHSVPDHHVGHSSGLPQAPQAVYYPSPYPRSGDALASDWDHNRYLSAGRVLAPPARNACMRADTPVGDDAPAVAGRDKPLPSLPPEPVSPLSTRPSTPVSEVPVSLISSRPASPAHGELQGAVAHVTLADEAMLKAYWDS